MENSKQGTEMLELMGIAETISADIKGTESGVKQDIKSAPNRYTRDEFKQMMAFIRDFANEGKQGKSFTYSQELLNKIGSDMNAFINKVKSTMSKDPAGHSPTDGKDIMAGTYNPNKHA